MYSYRIALQGVCDWKLLFSIYNSSQLRVDATVFATCIGTAFGMPCVLQRFSSKCELCVKYESNAMDFLQM